MSQTNTTPPQPPVDKYDVWTARVQKMLAPILGSIIVIHQLFFASAVEPLWLVFAAGALGLPLAIGLDRKLK